MSAFAGPSMIENGLVFAYDMGNTNKSWKGPPITNEAKNTSNQVDWAVGGLLQSVSRTTVIADEVYNISSTTGTGTSFRIYFTNAVLTNGATYTVSYRYKILSGGPLFRANDWCDTSITRVTTDLGGGVFYETATGTRATYDATFRFLDFEISNNTVVQIWDLQLELRSFATPYSSTRVRSNTQAILDLTNTNTVTINNLTYASNNTFSFDGVDDTLTSNTWNNMKGSGWNGQITLEGFLKINNPPTNSAMGYFGFNSAGAYFKFMNTGNLFLDCGSTVPSRINTNCIVGLSNYYGQWVHICAVYDGTVKTYLNGVLQATSSAFTLADISSVALTIGDGMGYFNFQGNIDIVKVYNKALSTSEVLQNFNAIRGRFGI